MRGILLTITFVVLYFLLAWVINPAINPKGETVRQWWHRRPRWSDCAKGPPWCCEKGKAQDQQVCQDCRNSMSGLDS